MSARHSIFRIGSLILAAVMLLAGCGESDESKPVPGTEGAITIVAVDSGDRKIAQDFTEYLMRGCVEEVPERVQHRLEDRPKVLRLAEASLDVCRGISEVEVDSSRIEATIELGEGVDRGNLGEAFCSFVRGSDVADFTPGHRLLDSNGEMIVNCGTHNAYR